MSGGIMSDLAQAFREKCAFDGWPRDLFSDAKTWTAFNCGGEKRTNELAPLLEQAARVITRAELVVGNTMDDEFVGLKDALNNLEKLVRGE